MTIVVFVAGLSGSGKSALSRHLAGCGELAISLDAVDGLCQWRNRSGPTGPPARSPESGLLRAHDWYWNADILDRLVAVQRDSGRPRSFLCGIAANQRQFLHRFDLVVMLDVPIEVMLARLDNTSRGNDFGRAGASRQRLVERFATDRAALLAIADHVIDATAPIDRIADTICALPAAGSDRRNPEQTTHVSERSSGT